MVGVTTLTGILIHEIPHEMADFAILLRAGFDRWQATKAQMLTGLGGILGAVIALFYSNSIHSMLTLIRSFHLTLFISFRHSMGTAIY